MPATDKKRWHPTAPSVTLQGMTNVTQILEQVEARQTGAWEQLFEAVYSELRRMAAGQMAKEQPGQTLQPTALVHEAYLRLAGNDSFQNRSYFFAAAGEAMRRILVEKARRKKRIKHGGQVKRIAFTPDVALAAQSEELLISIDAALSKMSLNYPVHARLVVLRYFGGCTNDEAALSLGISPSTADRHWAFAGTWLQRELPVE